MDQKRIEEIRARCVQSQSDSMHTHLLFFGKHYKVDVPDLLDALEDAQSIARTAHLTYVQQTEAIIAVGNENERLREALHEFQQSYTARICAKCGALFVFREGQWIGNHQQRCGFAKTT